MYPMNFEEFLIATENEMLRDKIKECYKDMSQMPDFAHEQAITLYKQYLCVGGMPEAVNNFIENKLDILKFDSHIISDIKDMYIADMHKYVKKSLETVKIEDEDISKEIKEKYNQYINEYKEAKRVNELIKKYNSIYEMFFELNRRKNEFEEKIEVIFGKGLFVYKTKEGYLNKKTYF